MTAQDESRGFCFHCSFPDPRFSATSGTSLCNPWPLLVQSNDLDIVISQPLIRTCYSPSPFVEVCALRSKRRKDQYDFIDWFNFLHEAVHLWYLDWTPAKELAKIYLAFCYDILSRLVLDHASSQVCEC
jgi:hypothetical protein